MKIKGLNRQRWDNQMSKGDRIQETGDRRHNIELIRFIFAVIIFYFHFNGNILSYAGENGDYAVLHELSLNSRITECFFLMSGYFLYYSAQKADSQSYLGFVVKKVLRLGPVLWFSILIGVLFFSTELETAVFNSLFLQCIGISLNYKGITWYVSPLFWGLIFYFALLKYFDRKKVHVFMAVIVYFSYVANIQRFDGGFGRDIGYGMLSMAMARSLAGLGLGYFIGLLFASVKKLGITYNFSKCSRVLCTAFFTCLELLSSIYLIQFFLLGRNYKNKFIVVIVFSILFICLLLRQGLLSRAMDRKAFAVLSKYAYSIYVMQQTCFNILKKTLWKTSLVQQTVLCLSISLAFCIAVGIGTYYLIELPGTKLSKKLEPLFTTQRKSGA